MTNFQSLKKNKIFKGIVFLVKIIIVALFTFIVYEMITKDLGSQLIGLSILILILLPSIFAFFLKERVAKAFPQTIKIWKWVRIVYVISFLVFLAGITFGFYRVYDKNRTEKAIDRINNTKITIADVMGENLPPVPDKELNDSTIAGIDSNNNFIRDDVELAIFEKYPDSAKVRAALLQYAQAKQIELLEIYNRETFIETQKKGENAYQCIGYALSDKYIYSELSGPKDFLNIVGIVDYDIMRLVVNTDLRENRFFNENAKYMTYFYSSDQNNFCDVNISTLPN